METTKRSLGAVLLLLPVLAPGRHFSLSRAKAPRADPDVTRGVDWLKSSGQEAFGSTSPNEM